MKKILVAGAGGYVGSVMCREFLKSGYHIVALDRYFFGLEKLADLNEKNLTIIRDDIRYFDEDVLKDVDVVIDLAGLSNDATSEIDPAFTKAINCDGSTRLATLAKKNGVKHYLYSSSASVYGFSNIRYLSETDKLNPLTEYSKSKVAVEKNLMALYDHNFNVTILRNSTIYGLSPRMRFDLAVNIMAMRGCTEGIIYIMGDGMQWRPFVHVKDVVAAFRLCMENPEAASGQIFNVGSNEQNYAIGDLAMYISDLLEDTKTIHIPDNQDCRSYSLDFSKINNVLGYTTRYTVKDGVLEIKEALKKGVITFDDPTTHTLNWYKTLLYWETKMNNLKVKDKIL
jgi:nucleoside-diphosphate-sugar epimerase